MNRIEEKGAEACDAGRSHIKAPQHCGHPEEFRKVTEQ